MDKSLTIAAEMIGLESMTPSQLVLALPARLPKFMQDVKHYLTSQFSTVKSSFLGATFAMGETERLIGTSNYYALSQLEIFIPMGLTKDYVGFVACLEANQKVADTLMADVLKPTSFWLGKVLSSPQELLSVRDNHGIQFRKLDELKRHTAAHFNKVSNQDKCLFGKVFRSNREFLESVTGVNNVTARLAHLDNKSLQAEVDLIVEMMDKLMIRMQQDPNTYQMSGVTAKAMAQIALHLAERVEFYAAHAALVQNTNGTLQLTMDKLKRVLKS